MKVLLVSNRAAESGQKPRFVGLLIVALLMAVLAEGSTIVISRLISQSGVPIQPSSYQFLLFSIPSYASFLVNPVFLFIMFYRLGRTIDLAGNYASVAICIFVGGLVGGSASFFLLPALLGSPLESAFPDFLSVVATVATLAVSFVRFGLNVLFPAFVAIAFANLRSGRLSGAPRQQNGMGEDK